MVPHFEPNYIINTDQMGCQIQSTQDRTYSYTGEQRANVTYSKLGKNTHSYTTQYTVTYAGKLLRRVFLCVQEPTGKFGPNVQRQVDELVAEFGNVVVTCSKSGKLSTDLY